MFHSRPQTFYIQTFRLRLSIRRRFYPTNPIRLSSFSSSLKSNLRLQRDNLCIRSNRLWKNFHYVRSPLTIRPKRNYSKLFSTHFRLHSRLQLSQMLFGSVQLFINIQLNNKRPSSI